MLKLPFEPEEDLSSINVDEFKSRLDRLTPTQRAVFKMLRQGRSNKSIAYEYKISVKTAEKHVGNICEHLKVESRIEAVSMYYRWLILWRERKCPST